MEDWCGNENLNNMYSSDWKGKAVIEDCDGNRNSKGDERRNNNAVGGV